MLCCEEHNVLSWKKLVKGWETERRDKRPVFSLARAWLEFLLSRNGRKGESRVLEGGFMKCNYLAQSVSGKALMYGTNVLLELPGNWLGSFGNSRWGVLEGKG